MSVRTFAVERLGVGDWPATDGSASKAIDPDSWAECYTDTELGFTAYAFDVTPDRAYCTIAGAGPHGDGWGVGPIMRDRGTGWVVDYLKSLRPSVLICDASGPAGSLVAELQNAGITVTPVTTREYANACGLFYDAIEQRQLAHEGIVELDNAVDGAAVRALGDSYAWSRKTSTADISPLVACTLALWGAHTERAPVAVYDLAEVAEKMRQEGRLPEGL